jgi:hypothetical protein
MGLNPEKRNEASPSVDVFTPCSSLRDTKELSAAFGKLLQSSKVHDGN